MSERRLRDPATEAAGRSAAIVERINVERMEAQSAELIRTNTSGA